MKLTIHEKPDTYHHGSLSESLVDAGISILEESGETDVSLRSVARRLGVSHNAPYRHFSSKDALFAAMSVKGFDNLYTELRKGIAAAAEEKTPVIYGATEGYVDFSLQYPSLTTLMLERRKEANEMEVVTAGQRAFGALEEAVASSRRKIGGYSETTMARYLWATAMGTIELMPRWVPREAPRSVLRSLILAQLAIGLQAMFRGPVPEFWPVSRIPVAGE